VLEEEGIEKFEASWTELTDSTKAELKRLAGKK
jgi:transaldolase